MVSCCSTYFDLEILVGVNVRVIGLWVPEIAGILVAFV
jgi:hypothetical protein